MFRNYRLPHLNPNQKLAQIGSALSIRECVLPALLPVHFDLSRDLTTRSDHRGESLKVRQGVLRKFQVHAQLLPL